MEHFTTLFADIRGTRDNKESSSSSKQQHPPPREEDPFLSAAEAAEVAFAGKDGGAREDRRSRARGNSRGTTRDPSRSTLRESTRVVSSGASIHSVHRDRESIYREQPPTPIDSKPSRHDDYISSGNRNSTYRHDEKNAAGPFADSKEKHWQEDLDPGPPPYQEIADASIPRPAHSHGPLPVASGSGKQAVEVDAPPPIDDDAPQPHPSGITPTERCVKDALSVPVDWVIHPSAPHFVICGRCYVDRIYNTHQWRREFVKYRPSTGLSLRCHLGAIPHMALRWSKVHTADEFLGFLKVMQRKKVARPCPGPTVPCSSSNIVWYTITALPGLRICQECRQQLFGGTGFSKHIYSMSSSDPAAAVPSVCHGSFNHLKRMVEILLEDDKWDHFVERVRVRLQVPSCPGQRDTSNSSEPARWYRYAPRSSSSSSASKDLYICEACYFDYAYKKTNMECDWPLADKAAPHHARRRCMASLREDLVPDMADVEYSRAEITRLLHGHDRRCYAQGTVGVKWYTIPSSPWGYGVCEGCYLTKIKPRITGSEDASRYFISKKDVGRRAAFACWMNAYHPFAPQHRLLLNEALILGDTERLEASCAKLSRMPGCQQGGMGQGKNRRWWGWRSLRICAACVKGGGLADMPAAKRWELHGEKDPYHRMCDLYSMQLRDRLLHHDDTGELLEFARRRQEMSL